MSDKKKAFEIHTPTKTVLTVEETNKEKCIFCAKPNVLVKEERPVFRGNVRMTVEVEWHCTDCGRDYKRQY